MHLPKSRTTPTWSYPSGAFCRTFPSPIRPLECRRNGPNHSRRRWTSAVYTKQQSERIVRIYRSAIEQLTGIPRPPKWSTYPLLSIERGEGAARGCCCRVLKIGTQKSPRTFSVFHRPTACASGQTLCIPCPRNTPYLAHNMIYDAIDVSGRE